MDRTERITLLHSLLAQSGINAVSTPLEDTLKRMLAAAALPNPL